CTYRFSKFGWCKERDIISDQSLEAVREIVTSLRSNDNGSVPPEIIATDVLGLLKQELSAKHLALTSLLLNLLDTVIKVSPADELRGNTLPTSMLPLFFNIQNQHMSEWRRIATIFVEVIRQATYHLETCFPCDENNRRMMASTAVGL
ncbi:unnamed protein product, partial [Callosobruchus maculatus]